MAREEERREKSPSFLFFFLQEEQIGAAQKKERGSPLITIQFPMIKAPTEPSIHHQEEELGFF